MQLNDRTRAPYGFGWNVDRRRGQRRMWHTGGLPGFVSTYLRYPDAGLAVIALTNGDSTDIGRIAAGAASLYREQLTSSAGATP